MWLLDANIDIHLLAFLAGAGIRCEAAIRRGWGALRNGELVAAAVQAGFTCILTHDRLFAESARSVLQANAQFAIVVVGLPQRPWREYIAQFSLAWEKEPILPVPGTVKDWPRVQ